MYKQVLNSITDVDIFPVVSLMLFLTFFVLMLIKVYHSSKTWTDHMSSLPLEEEVPKIHHNYRS